MNLTTLPSGAQLTAVDLCNKILYLEDNITYFSMYLLIDNAEPDHDRVLFEEVSQSFQKLLGSVRNLRRWADGRVEWKLEEFTDSELTSALMFIQKIVKMHDELANVFYTVKDTSSVFMDASEDICGNFFAANNDSIVHLRSLFTPRKTK